MKKNTNSKIITGALAVSLAAIMWGIDGVILTPNLLNTDGFPLDATFVVFVLHCIPFIIMNAFWYKYYKMLKQFSVSDYIYIISIALFGGMLGTFCIVKALFIIDFQNLTIIALLQKLQPVFAIVLSVILLKEKISKNYFIFASLAIVAGYIMTFGFNAPTAVSKNVISASLLALLAAFSFGASTVLSKKMLNKYPPMSITFFRYGFTTVMALLVVVITGVYTQFSITPLKTWIIFLIIAFTTGSGAILLYYYGLKNISASLSTICELLFPISAAILDYFINDNTMTIVQWIAAAVMIFAIIALSKGAVSDNKMRENPKFVARKS